MAAATSGFLSVLGVARVRSAHNSSRNLRTPAIRCSATFQGGAQLVNETKNDSTVWKIFTERVSGEWDGYGADFSSFGEPLKLPSSVIPDAFRDWGVEVHDWQTMCPTLARDEPQSFTYKVIRLLPTVGCEADAATPYITEERDFSVAKYHAFHASGSYCAVWPGKAIQRNSSAAGSTSKVIERNYSVQDQFEVEHCLVQEGGLTRSRARILQQLTIVDAVPKVTNICVYIEQWDGPFRNGESLGGCSTSGSGFASTPRLETESLAGNWRVETYLAGEFTSPRNQLTSQGVAIVERSYAENVVGLPKRLWSSVKASKDSSAYIIEAGWSITADRTVVSSCEYLPAGAFKSSSFRVEERV